MMESFSREMASSLFTNNPCLLCSAASLLWLQVMIFKRYVMRFIHHGSPSQATKMVVVVIVVMMVVVVVIVVMMVVVVLRGGGCGDR